MKESQIIQQRIESLEIDLATARQVLAEVTREEAATIYTREERREYAQELYSKILDLECDSIDIESDAVDGFIEQVIDPVHRKEIAEATSGAAYFGSRPIIQVCNQTTLDRIIEVLEACLDFIDDNGVLDTWTTYDPVNCVVNEYSEDEDADDDEELF
jgi:hypothetical protein